MKHLAILAALAATPALGQSSCADRDAMAEVLAEVYGEQQRLFALSGSQLLEFWGNERTGTWTLFVVYADGLACVLGVSDQGFAVAKAGPDGEAM